MSTVEEFLTKEEEQEIIAAIRIAEKNTSGEIRVHIESHSEKAPYERAKEVFYLLKMNTTKDANGVLLYVAVKDKNFVIYGDKGIDNLVPKNFWNSTRDVIQYQFQLGNFKQGIIEGVLKTGEELKTHFPWKKEDTNELSNEISKR